VTAEDRFDGDGGLRNRLNVRGCCDDRCAGDLADRTLPGIMGIVARAQCALCRVGTSSTPTTNSRLREAANNVVSSSGRSEKRCQGTPFPVLVSIGENS